MPVASKTSRESSVTSLLEQKVDQVQDDVREMRDGMRQIAEAVTRLAIVEERHKGFEASLNRIADRMDKLDARQREQEVTRDTISGIGARVSLVENKAEITQMEQVKFDSTIKGIGATMKVFWAVMGTGVVYVASQLLHLVGNK